MRLPYNPLQILQTNSNLAPPSYLEIAEDGVDIVIILVIVSDIILNITSISLITLLFVVVGSFNVLSLCSC